MMTDMSEREDAMLLAAGKNGGEYLEEIKQYDLRHMSKDEWSQFLRCVVGKWHELAALQKARDDLDDEIPF